MIQADSLVKTYRMGENEIHALDHVSFGIAEGEMIAIMGPSGSGKIYSNEHLGMFRST